MVKANIYPTAIFTHDSHISMKFELSHYQIAVQPSDIEAWRCLLRVYQKIYDTKWQKIAMIMISIIDKYIEN